MPHAPSRTLSLPYRPRPTRVNDVEPKPYDPIVHVPDPEEVLDKEIGDREDSSQGKSFVGEEFGGHGILSARGYVRGTTDQSAVERWPSGTAGGTALRLLGGRRG